MKVLVFTWEYPPHIDGGLGEHIKGLLPALMQASQTLELHVLTPTFDGQARTDHLEQLYVHWVAVDKPADQHIYRDVVRGNGALAATAQEVVAAHGPFDLLHVHDWLPSFAAREVADQLQIPLLATIHATERGRYGGALYSDLSRGIDAAEIQLAQRAELVIACSDAMQHEVHHFFHIPWEKTVVVPNGINAEPLLKLQNKDLADFRARYALPYEQIVFNVGRLVYEKGADLLVEAAPHILYRNPNAKFVIGGRGPLHAFLEQRIHALHLSHKILLAGFLSDDVRDQLYVAADVCVFPSRYEPFGIVALEAMAAGTPVVASAVGGLGSVVQHEHTGLTTYVGDVYSLAWAVTRTFDDPGAAAARAARAEQMVQTELTWPVIADHTLAVYRRVAKETSPDFA